MNETLKIVENLKLSMLEWYDTYTYIHKFIHILYLKCILSIACIQEYFYLQHWKCQNRRRFEDDEKKSQFINKNNHSLKLTSFDTSCIDLG